MNIEPTWQFYRAILDGRDTGPAAQLAIRSLLRAEIERLKQKERDEKAATSAAWRLTPAGKAWATKKRMKQERAERELASTT